MVWLYTRELALKVSSRKVSPRNVGPFKVIKHINSVSYCLHLPTNYHILPPLHDSLLKPVSSIKDYKDGSEKLLGYINSFPKLLL